jgi:hypothetical protein
MRLILAGLLLLAGGALFSPALAQDNAVDPIDATLSQCLEKPAANSTTGMVACFNAARDAWEKEVVRAYSDLSATLDARSRGILRGTQKQWEAYKAAEQRFQQAGWARDRGTMIAVTLASQNADFFKNRALTLRGYRAE